RDRSQAIRQIDRELTARDPSFIRWNLAAELEVLLGKFIQEIAPELLLQDVKQDPAPTKRAKIVAQDLALPFRIGEILPALGLVLRLDQPRVDQDAVDDRKYRQTDVVGFELRLQVTEAWQRPVGIIDVVLGDLQRGRGPSVL